VRVVLCVLLLVGGCRASLPLEPRWRPLVEVVERPGLGSADPGVTTLGTRVYVRDLDAFAKRYPAGTPEREALLSHEREHARRQLALGLGSWLARYLSDAGFMWREEQVGWGLELRLLRESGRSPRPEAVALALSRYRNLSGRMVGYSQALAWVRDVLRGRAP